MVQDICLLLIIAGAGLFAHGIYSTLKKLK